jgi:hypothetical protein
MQRFPIPARLFLASLLFGLMSLPALGRDDETNETGRASADRLTPADAGFIVSVNFRQILDSPLIKKNALPAINAALAKEAHVRKLLETAGLDPLKDIDSLTVTGTIEGKQPRGFAVLRGRFQPDKLLAVLTEHAKEKAEKVKILDEGGLKIVRFEDHKPVFAAFADNKTLIIAPEKSDLLEVVGRASKGPARLSKDLAGAIAKVSGKDALWLAVVISDEIKKALPGDNPAVAELVGPVKAITGGIELTDAVGLAIVIHTGDEDGASALKKKIDEFLPALNLFIPPDGGGRMAKEVLSTLKVANDKNAVRISLQLSEEILKKAASQTRKKDKDKDKDKDK